MKASKVQPKAGRSKELFEREVIRESVRRGYAAIAEGGGSCCGSAKSCCGGAAAGEAAKAVGYSDAELATLPDGSNMGLSCWNP